MPAAKIGTMAAPQSTPPPAKPKGANRKGLNWKEWVGIAMLLAVGVGLAALLMFEVPTRMVSEQDYRCPSADTASSQATASGVSVSCLGRAGADGIDDQALGQARAAVRAPFGVLSAGLLAGAAAAIGVIVSNHNAALTRGALDATVETNKITKERDDKTSARENDRDHAAAARDRDAAARERERAADDRFTTAIDQLGHPSASVRLGGMHSLHRLALGDGERLPTIVDVLCAYLRQPFHHPAHDWDPDAEHPSGAVKPSRAWWTESQKERDERDSEREVRSTATRLIPTLLPPATTPLRDGDAPQPPGDDQTPPLEINLNGAMLDGLDLSGRVTGRLRLDGAHITGDLRLDEGAHITGNLELGDGAYIDGNLLLGAGAHIDGDLELGEGAHITGRLEFADGARITKNLRLRENAHIDGGLWLFKDARIDSVIWLHDNAHIDGGLWLDANACITRGLSVGARARIAGHGHVDGTATVGRVYVDPEAAMESDWFRELGVSVQ